MQEPACLVWGPELSPFVLKLEAMLRQGALPFRRLPRDGSRLETLRVAGLLDRARRSRRARCPGPESEDDALREYPAVPFLVTAQGEVLYDSTALAFWIDENSPTAGLLVDRAGTVSAAGFVGRFLDEAFDEVGLYLVHHNRWKLAAGDNGRPGRRLARAFRTLLPPGLGPLFAPWFERRQVRRLPYLFSVAPPGYRVPGLPRALTPPSREGFPPTHRLLEETWERILAALEQILAVQPFLLGQRFSLADASAYGQLSMNLTDAAAARRLLELAPRTHAWLEAIRDGRVARRETGSGRLDPCLAPLLECFLDTFAPLMQANEAAYVDWHSRGVRTFNEKAFDAGLALFEIHLAGHPCRSVVKTFQVVAWRQLRRLWRRLDGTQRSEVAALAGGRDLERLFLEPDPDDGAAAA